jgi:hypothetical protein
VEKKPVPSGAVAVGGAAGTSAASPTAGMGEAPDPYKDRRNQLAPMPESELRGELETIAQTIDVQQDLGAALAPAVMAKALSDKLGDYSAVGPASTGTTPAELGEATVAARQYKQGNARLNLKITDTAHAPQVRADFVPQLTSVGNAPTGEQSGALEHGIAGVRAFHKEQNVSRAVALLGGRLFVEALVENAVKPDDAWRAITALDAGELTRQLKAAGAKPAKKKSP